MHTTVIRAADLGEARNLVRKLRPKKHTRGRICSNVMFSNTSIDVRVPVLVFSAKLSKGVLPLQWRDLCALK